MIIQLSQNYYKELEQKSKFILKYEQLSRSILTMHKKVDIFPTAKAQKRPQQVTWIFF